MTEHPGGAAGHIARLENDIERLKNRIEDLEGGECRFHCRVRADMWKAGFRWGFVRAHKSLASVDDMDREYKKWRERNVRKS